MEMYVLCIVTGILLAGSFVMIGVTLAHANERISEKRNKCKYNNNTILCDGGDNMCDSVLGNVHEPIDCGQDLGLDREAEEAINVLNTIRVGASATEKHAIDFAIDCIGVRVRLEQFFEERGI